MQEAIEKAKNDQDIQWYLESLELQRKQSGLRSLFSLHANKLESERKVIYYSEIRAKLNDVIKPMTEKYQCTEREIIIAFDEGQELEKRLDTYLRKKMRKGVYEDDLTKLRSEILKQRKLNPEIRMMQNAIAWAYGEVVFLFGNEEKNIRTVCSTGEATMRSPLAGEAFHSFSLEDNSDVLILGPRNQLQPFKDKYGDKIVYLEDLTYSQKKFFNVPKKLW